MKTCVICKIEKDDICFTKHRGGLRAQCKMCRKEIQSIYYANNNKKQSRQKKIYYSENRDKKIAQNKQYRILNKDAFNIRKRQKYNTDPSFRLRSIISRAIAAFLKRQKHNKNGKSCLNYLDYTIKQLKAHIQNKFEPWMTWRNQGRYNSKTWDDNDHKTWTWQLDHIVPQSKLPYVNMTDDNFKKCWSLENLRPYSAKQNVIENSRDNG
jgi:hypothetical protein